MVINKGFPLIKPMLAVSSQPFDDISHIFEIKWDGYRCLLYLDDKVRLLSRNGKELTETFPELRGVTSRLRQGSLLDGEIIVLDEGLPSFNILHKRGRLKDKNRITRAVSQYPAMFVAFDILYYRGSDIMNFPLKKRKEMLNDSVKAGGNILISEYIKEKGRQFSAACREKGLEGTVGKHIESIYQPGRRSAAWKKIRITKEADLVICGFSQGKGSNCIGSLLVGGYDGKERLLYQGRVGSGISVEEEKILLNELLPLVTEKPVLEIPPGERKGVTWVKPELVCTVNYLSLTGGGLLRHPVYKGFRMDKRPVECRALYL